MDMSDPQNFNRIDLEFGPFKDGWNAAIKMSSSLKELTISDLLPCPFCGGTKIGIIEALGVYWGKCDDCFASGPMEGDTEHETAAAWNQRAPRWIPVSERLPDTADTVLVWEAMAGEMLVGWKGKTNWAVVGEDKGDEINITHWKPLPTPPKGADHE